MARIRNTAAAFVAIVGGLALTGMASAETQPPVDEGIVSSASTGFVRGGKPTTRMVIEQDSDRMVVGQTQTLSAKWCTADGECTPAAGLRWTSDTPGILSVKPSTGATVEMTALRPGYGWLTAENGKTGFSPGAFVFPRPGTSDPPPPVTPRRLEVAYPGEMVLDLGEHAVVTGWRCPTRGAKQLGQDAIPGTDDDECRTKAIGDVNGFEESGLALVGMAGPSAVVVAQHRVGIGRYALAPDPVRLSFVDRLQASRIRDNAVGTSHVYVRDARFKGRPVGDLNDDRLVDAADAAVLAAVLQEHGPLVTKGGAGWRTRLDLNQDRRIDSTDERVLALLIGSHSGEIEPERLIWYALRRGLGMPIPSGPDPAPTPVPTTTPTQ